MVGSRPGGGAAQPLAGWANALRRVRTLAHITQVVVLVVFSKIGPVLKNKYSKKYCQQNHCYVKKMTLQSAVELATAELAFANVWVHWQCRHESFLEITC